MQSLTAGSKVLQRGNCLRLRAVVEEWTIIYRWMLGLGYKVLVENVEFLAAR